MSTENATTPVTQTPLGTYLLRIVIGLFLVGLLLAYSMSYQVNEGTQCVLTRFDRPVKTIEKAGLYWKLPWPIEKAHPIDMRKHLFNTPHVDTLTKDASSVQLVTYVIWKVSDPLQYLQSLGRGETYSEKTLISAAEKEMEGKVVNSETRFVGNFDMSALISVNEKNNHTEDIEKLILHEIKDSVKRDFGIDVLQVGIKRLAVPENNMKSVLDSMREDRRKIASNLRAEGTTAADKIKKDADVLVAQYLSEGEIEAGKITAAAEKEATQIDANANQLDPEFYAFWRSMQTLKNTLSGNGTIVLRTDHQFFKTLFDDPNKKNAQVEKPE